MIKHQNAISPTREQDYPEWYQQVVKEAELAEMSAVRGCMVIKPWGYAIWELIQTHLDRMFKDTGHKNAYFPLFIPLNYLEKEAKHVEGFAKECAVVTHHRLEADNTGGLRPTSPLEEPLIVRPTSETIIGASFSRWIHSHRDLPLLINQWANVVRWELRPRVFLRTTEFLWQEGHTAHATSAEAIEETHKMLSVYVTFAEKYLAIPVIKGEKTAAERFPGAVNTFCIEAMMQDRKALQAGTSHFLGQNFSRAQKITFQDQNGQLDFAWTTSWGVSTRLIGALIMTHSDDNGLVLPPMIAPLHAIILPITRNDDERAAVLEFCKGLEKELSAITFRNSPIRVEVDARDARGGEKNWYHIKRGVPIRIEVGAREMQSENVSYSRRDRGPKETITVGRHEFVRQIAELLEDVQKCLFERAALFRDEHTRRIDNLSDFIDYFTPKTKNKREIHGGFAISPCDDTDPRVQEYLANLKVTTRCLPLDEPDSVGSCIFTGKPLARCTILAKAY